MNNIFLIARFFIHKEKTGEFKRIADECIEIVKEKEPETLKYDWFFNEAGTECAVLENYKDSGAALTHLANVGTQLGQLMEMADFKGEIYGEMSQELKSAVKGLDVKVYSFFGGKQKI